MKWKVTLVLDDEDQAAVELENQIINALDEAGFAFDPLMVLATRVEKEKN